MCRTIRYSTSDSLVRLRRDEYLSLGKFAFAPLALLDVPHLEKREKRTRNREHTGHCIERRGVARCHGRQIRNRHHGARTHSDKPAARLQIVRVDTTEHLTTFRRRVAASIHL